jgi:hypothetical protein
VFSIALSSCGKKEVIVRNIYIPVETPAPVATPAVVTASDNIYVPTSEQRLWLSTLYRFGLTAVFADVKQILTVLDKTDTPPSYLPPPSYVEAFIAWYLTEWTFRFYGSVRGRSIRFYLTNIQPTGISIHAPTKVRRYFKQHSNHFNLRAVRHDNYFYICSTCPYFNSRTD